MLERAEKFALSFCASNQLLGICLKFEPKYFLFSLGLYILNAQKTSFGLNFTPLNVKTLNLLCKISSWSKLALCIFCGNDEASCFISKSSKLMRSFGLYTFSSGKEFCTLGFGWVCEHPKNKATLNAKNIPFFNFFPYP